MILFGFEINRAKKTQEDESVKSFAIPQNDDGAVTIQSGAYYGTYVDLDGVVRNEIELITRYRELSIQPEIETAIDEIVNEAIVNDDTSKGVELNLDDLKQPAAIKKKINEEFETILKLLDFSNMGHDLFRRWYVDGRMFYHIIVDEANTSKGIRELRYVDPRRIRKIREIQKAKEAGTGTEIVKSVREYYIYNERGVVGAPTNLGMKIAVDSVVNINSGLMDSKRSMVLSYLHKAIKPFNNLRMVEDATVIYRLSRAPERRIFYVDVGNMSTVKAEQYLKDIMTKYRNKLVYDSTTGEIKDDRKHLSMLEDFWLPRREGCFSLSTKIKLLDGRDVELGQLIVEHKMGKNNWVYSVSPEGEVVPGKISWAGVTRNEAEVLDIHLDNGEVVTATPDHKFILRNGIKIEAKDLHVGSSLMPLNTRNKHITHNRNGEYLQIQDNKTSEWKFTHRMVAENIHGKKKINEVVHHVDFTRWNNNPENLQYMDGKEHFLYHSKMGTRSWANGNVEEHKKNLSESLLRFYYETEKGRERRQQISNFNRECEEIWKGFAKGRQKIKENRARDREILTKEEYLAKWSKGLSIEASRKGTEVWKKTIEFDRKNLTKEEFFEKHGKAKSTTLIKKYRASKSHIDLSQIQKVLETCLKNNVDCKNEVFVEEIAKIYPDINNIKRFRTLLRHNGYNTITEFIHRSFGDEYVSLKRNVSLEKKSNHTVVKIVHRTDRMDVGTLTIDENHEYHDYHNFALSSGIFVMNSRGTEITTLPGGMNLGELEDVKYFEKKLYKSLGVPISRLEPSQGFSLGRTTEIQRDELKFNKFIARLRNKFSSIFDDLLRVQLILKKVCTEEEWREFKEDVWYDFKQDNNFSELKESELLTNRLSLLAVVDPFVGRYYSKEWVRKNVLKQDDKDMEEIDEQIANEAQDATPAVDSMGNQIDPVTGQPLQPAPTDQMNGQPDPNAVPEPEQVPSKFSLPTNSIETS